MSSQPVFGKRLKVWGERRGQQAQARGRVWVSHAGAGNERTAESEPQGSLSAVCLQTKFLFPPQKFCTGRSSPSSFLLQQWLQSKIRQTRSRGKKPVQDSVILAFFDSLARAGTAQALAVEAVRARAGYRAPRRRGQTMGQSGYPKHGECYSKRNQVELIMTCHGDSL